jgi:hypothetical protein
MNSRMLSNENRVPEPISSLAEFDILGLQQYADQWQRTNGLQPEKSLMLAVLLDAVECFQKCALLHDEYSKRLFRETEIWIFEDDQERLFSFVNVCEALGLYPQYLRKGLLRWQQNGIQLSARKDRNKRSA